MNPLRRRESATREKFSFENSRIRRTTDVKTSGFDAYKFAGRIKCKNGQFGNSDDANFSKWNPQIANVSPGKQNDEDEFRWLIKSGGVGCRTPSPQLWKNGGSPISKSAGNSPKSGARQIEKFRQEMLEMVRDMPEISYELSLRDIVESAPQRPVRSCKRLIKVSEFQFDAKEEHAKTTMNRRISRNGSGEIGGGLMIKMLTPFSVGCGAKKKRKILAGCSMNAKVSPRPSFAEGERSGSYSTDSERPKRNELRESGSRSYYSSNSSNNSAISRLRKMTIKLISFLQIKAWEI